MKNDPSQISFKTTKILFFSPPTFNSFFYCDRGRLLNKSVKASSAQFSILWRPLEDGATLEGSLCLLSVSLVYVVTSFSSRSNWFRYFYPNSFCNYFAPFFDFVRCMNNVVGSFTMTTYKSFRCTTILHGTVYSVTFNRHHLIIETEGDQLWIDTDFFLDS